MSFLEELKRRNVLRVGIAYLITAWLVAQIADLVLDNIDSPDWVMQTIMLVLALGFPFALIFAWAFELTPEGIKKEKDVDRTQSITPKTGRKLDFVIIGIMAIALSWFAWDKFVASTPAPAEPAAAAAEQPAKSIAVLPFVNMSDDASNEYFSDGISEEILNALARVKNLKVAGRTSSFSFKGQNQDLRQIGEALGVEHILEGSVRKAGNMIRITAQLIQTEDGFHLWSETYDRELTDVFAIQDEIAGAILEQLKAQLMGAAVTEIASTTTDTEAYDLYLLAKQRMYERTGPTIQSAADLLDRAIAIDPSYAPAYAQRAITSLLLSEGAGSYGDIPREQAHSQAQGFIDQALQLDPNQDEALAAQGLLKLQDPLGTNEAIKALEKALAINPGLINASNWLHNAYQQAGQPAKARQIVMDMIERDPLYRPGVRNAITSFIWFGEPDKALAHLERIRPLIPNDATLLSSEAAVRSAMGEDARATELIELAVALQPSNSVARITRSFAWLDTHQFERVAEEGEEFTPIFALAVLGRMEEASIKAFKYVEKTDDVASLFSFLNMADRSGELLEYLEARWPDLDGLQQDFPPYGGLGYFIMLDIALAYSRAGNQERFDDAMRRIQNVHQNLVAQGIKNSEFFMSEASYLSMAGNLVASMDNLDRAIQTGAISSKRMAFNWPCLAPLEGHPRFEAIQARMIQHVNAERQKLGLEPISI